MTITAEGLVVWLILACIVAFVILPTIRHEVRAFRAERLQRLIQREKDEASREQRIREHHVAAIIHMDEYRKQVALRVQA